jgi:hypothetical protein
VKGTVLATTLVRKTRGWKHLVIPLRTGPKSTAVQIRLYAPQGIVAWDDIRVMRATRSHYPDSQIMAQRIPSRPAAATEFANADKDIAGVVSNAIRVEQTRVLVRHIADRPILGSGFGAIARDYPYGTSYSYELSYLDLLFKTGVVGLLLFLSFPLRLVWDAVSARRGRLTVPAGVAPRETSVVIAIVVSVLIVGATNPYLFAAFGLLPVIVGIGWLDARAEVEGKATSTRTRGESEHGRRSFKRA